MLAPSGSTASVAKYLQLSLSAVGAKVVLGSLCQGLLVESPQLLSQLFRVLLELGPHQLLLSFSHDVGHPESVAFGKPPENVESILG